MLFLICFRHYVLRSRYYNERRHFPLETPYSARVCNAAVRFARHGSLHDIEDVRALMVPCDYARNFALLGTLSLETVRTDDDRVSTLITYAIAFSHMSLRNNPINMPELLDHSIAWIWMEMPARAFAAVITRLRKLPGLSSTMPDIKRVGCNSDSAEYALENFVQRAHTTVTVTVLMFARLERYPREAAGLYRLANMRSHSVNEVFARAMREGDTCVAALLSPFCNPINIQCVINKFFASGNQFCRRYAQLRYALVREHALPVGAGSEQDSVAYRALDCIFALTNLNARNTMRRSDGYKPIEHRACCSVYASEWSKRLARLAAERKSALVELAENTQDARFAVKVALCGIEYALDELLEVDEYDLPYATGTIMDEYTRACGRYFERVGWCFLATALDFKRDLCTRCYPRIN